MLQSPLRRAELDRMLRTHRTYERFLASIQASGSADPRSPKYDDDADMDDYNEPWWQRAKRESYQRQRYQRYHWKYDPFDYAARGEGAPGPSGKPAPPPPSAKFWLTLVGVYFAVEWLLTSVYHDSIDRRKKQLRTTTTVQHQQQQQSIRRRRPREATAAAAAAPSSSFLSDDQDYDYDPGDYGDYGDTIDTNNNNTNYSTTTAMTDNQYRSDQDVPMFTGEAMERMRLRQRQRNVQRLRRELGTTPEQDGDSLETLALLQQERRRARKKRRDVDRQRDHQQQQQQREGETEA